MLFIDDVGFNSATIQSPFDILSFSPFEICILNRNYMSSDIVGKKIADPSSLIESIKFFNFIK